MPKMRRIIPIRVTPVAGSVFCMFARPNTKYHVSLAGTTFEPRCGATNTHSLMVYLDTKVEVTDVCKRCLKYTEEVG